jgi:hypothetical protein
MRLVQQLLKQILDCIRRIQICHMLVSGKYNAFNSSKRIPDVIVHLSNSLEPAYHFNHLPPLGQLPPQREQRR